MRVTASKAISHKVAAALRLRGETTINELLKDLPELSRIQIQKALDNARGTGLVQLLVRGQGAKNGGRPGIWAALESRAPATRRPTRPAASVWELGDRRITDKWPPAFDHARQYAPLGSWDEEVNDNNRSAA